MHNATGVNSNSRSIFNWRMNVEYAGLQLLVLNKPQSKFQFRKSSFTQSQGATGSTKMDTMVSLKDISPAAQNNINTQFIVLDKMRTAMEGQNNTCLALVADETAAVHFQFWQEECGAFEPGDIVRLKNGIFSYNRNNLVLRAGKRGRVEKVGEFTMAFVETPNMSEIRWVPDPNNSKKYVQEAVISKHSRIFPPRP